MIQFQKGFTLIEVMVVVAIVGIAAFFAVPSYQDYVTRTRISEGIVLATDAKLMVATDGIRSAAELGNVVAVWNAQAGGTGANSKYVTSVLIDNAVPSTGIVTITFNAPTTGVGAGANRVLMSPYVRRGAPMPLAAALATVPPTMGTIDWACTSTTSAYATSKGLTGAATGTLLARYAPATCR